MKVGRKILLAIAIGAIAGFSTLCMVAQYSCFSWMKWDILNYVPFGLDPSQLRNPTAIAMHPTGNIYVGDQNNRVLIYSSRGDFLSDFELHEFEYSDFHLASGIAINASGHVYVTDGGGYGIGVYSPSGQFMYQFGSYGSGDGQFYSIPTIAINASGYVYVLDGRNQRVEVFNQTGQFLFKWGSYGSGEGNFTYPHGITINATGYVYVADSNNDRIQVFTPTGQFLFTWGSSGSGDGQFNDPVSICLDGDYVWVADRGNNRIQVFSADGSFMSNWGSAGECPGNIIDPFGITIKPVTGETGQRLCYVISRDSQQRCPALTIFLGGFTLNKVPDLLLILSLVILGSVGVIAFILLSRQKREPLPSQPLQKPSVS